MSQGLHLISSNIPDYGISEGRCLPCSRISGRAVVSSYSSHCNYKLPSQVKILFKNNLAYDTRRFPFACMASSGGHRRNPDFSRQSRQGRGFSRSKNRQNQEKPNSSENIDENETEFLSSKNGPLLSLSGSPKFQATATPGPREKEIVQLFRKVQAQLRERAAIKEEKKIEASQGQKEQGTVDSLLKLLRKHSSEQGKKSSGGSSSEDFNLDQPEKNSPFHDEPNPNFFDSDAIATELQEPRPASFTRPASSFRRKSPVPRTKYQSVVYSTAADESIIPSSKSQGKKKKSAIPLDGLDPEPISLESQKEAFDDLSESADPDEAYDEGVEPSSNLSELESSDPDEAYDESVESSSTEDTDLGSLKVSELRVLAKSRGVKGYSKLKKGELLELLSNYTS